jgi:hypothetical protein
MLSLSADAHALAGKEHHEVKAVVFDQDGVLVGRRGAWERIRGPNGSAQLYRLLRKGVLDLSEVRDIYEAGMRERGTCREDFIKAAREAELEKHAQEVVKELYDKGKKLFIVTLAPSIFARVIAERLHPEAFLRQNASAWQVPMNVHGNIALFDSRGLFVSVVSYPTGARQPWEFRGEINKRLVLDGIRERHGWHTEELLYVCDGYDTEVSRYYPTVGYRHTSGTLHTVAEITDLRELLRLV